MWDALKLHNKNSIAHQNKEIWMTLSHSMKQDCERVGIESEKKRDEKSKFRSR